MSDAEHHERTGLEVAIIGLAGRFPGADDVRQFWQNLRSGAESIQDYFQVMQGCARAAQLGLERRLMM